MSEIEKPARLRKNLGWLYVPALLVLALLLRAFKLQDGEISAQDFLWCMALSTPVLFVAAVMPWAENRRLRRVARERAQQRHAALSLEG